MAEGTLFRPKQGGIESEKRAQATGKRRETTRGEKDF